MASEQEHSQDGSKGRRGLAEWLIHLRILPRSRLRLVLNILGILFITLVLILLILTQTPLAKRVVLPIIEAVAGVEADARAVRIELDGTLVFDGLTLRIPGIDGPGGQLLAASRVVIVPEYRGLLLQDSRIGFAHLQGARIRLSIDADTGRPNFAALAGQAGGGERFEPPVLSINASRLEYGEHSGGAYEVLKSLALNGSIQRAGDGYEATVLAVSQATGERIRIAATLQDDRLQATLDEVDLVHWPAAIAPRPIRPLASALDAKGSASEVGFTYDFESSAFSIAGVLDDVAMSLPFDRDGNYRLTGERARISQLSGVISIDSVEGVSARARGMIETLPYELSIESEALSFEEPFRIGLVTRGFALTEDISLLSFAPDDVLDEFARFDRLKGTVDAAALIERRRLDDGSLSGGEVTATLSFRDATASYRSFPYTFRNMTGTVMVSPDLTVRIVGIEGVADTGATVSASGVVRNREGASPAEALQVELDIEVDNVPVGPEQEAFVTMLSDQREVVEQLFATDMLIGLTEEQLAVPGVGRFEVGGLADVDIILRRRFGGRGSWSNRIVVTAPQLGLIPKAFPLPIVAEDLLLTLYPLPDDRIRAEVIRGVALAAGGGRGVADLELLLGGGEGADGEAEIEPELSIAVRDLPASEPLEHAISLVGGERGDDREALRAFFDRLGPTGTLSGDVWVGRLESGELGVQVFADVRDGALALSGALGEGALIENIEGVVEVFERAVHVDLVGVAPATDSSIAAIATIELGSDDPFIEVVVDADGADTALPIVESIAAFSTGAARAVDDILRSRDIRGRADVRTRVTLEPDAPPTIRVVAGEVVEVSFDVFTGVRATLSRSSGEAVVEVGSELRFRDFQASLAVNGKPGGRVRVDGILPLTDDGLGDGGAVEFVLDDAPLDSALAQRLLREQSGISADALKALALQGEFSAAGTLSARAGEIAVVGTVTPRSLALTLDGSRIEFPGVAGEVQLDEAGIITLANIALDNASGWSASVDGTIDTGNKTIDLSAELASEEGIPQSLLALLPGAARDALAQIGLAVTGPVAVTLQRLEGSLGEDGAIAVEGAARFEQAAAEVGVSITEAAGLVRFSVAGDDATVTLDLARAVAMGVSASNIRGTIELADGVVSFPQIAADMHSGRVTTRGSLTPTSRGRRYDVSVGLSDVRLPALLADLSDEPLPGGEAESFGRLDGGVTLSGIAGRTETRTGRGEIRVPDGSVITNAFFARLVSVGNLQVPTSGNVTDARASFFIRGNRMSFDRISALVQSVELYGFGLLELDTQELDLYFSSRRLERIPVLTDLFDGIKDELITARVTGTLTDRNVFAEALPVTRRILEAIFGTESSGSAALDALRSRALESSVRHGQQQPLQPVAGVGGNPDN